MESRVNLYFQQAGISKNGNFQMYLKAALLLGWLAASYYGLVFRAAGAWQGGLWAVSLALAVAGVGFNIQHDGNHGSFSRRPWVNRLAGLTLDLLGGSSYVWICKHNVSHHTYTNIPDGDEDIDVSPFGRLSAAEPHRSFHRFQHLYLWFFYALLLLQWHLYGDFKKLWTGKIGARKFARPRGWEVVILVAGKSAFFTFAFLIPGLRHPLWVVGVFYLGTALLVGLIIAVVFQLAHIVEETRHPASMEDVKTDWAVHQVQTTADFSRGNGFLTWYLGGLNFQVIHHLFPRICHVHYPALSPLVAQVCIEFGLKYQSNESLFAAIRSHFRFLKSMGQPARPQPALN
jgi:linoleoyl-CoA desaturase